MPIKPIITHPPIVLRGIPAAPGIAIGKAFIIKEDSFGHTRRSLARDEVKKEIQRFRVSVTKTRADIRQNRERILTVLGKSHEALIDVHLLILDDALFSKDIERKIAEEQVNAESALVSVVEHVSKAFDKLGDEYFRQRKDDILDVAKLVMRHLLGRAGTGLSELRERSVIIAQDLGPSETMSMRDDLVEGFATNIGGRTSHTAIIAQGLQIPAVVGLRDVFNHVKSGDMVIVDGGEGLVIINPALSTLENYRKVREIQLSENRDLEKYKDLPAQTQDGHRIVLACNLESPEEVKVGLANGAEGIGLYRTEFMYLNRRTPPTEEEHFKNYSEVAKQMLPFSVIVRTMDLGGDKLVPLGVGGFNSESNPFLGLRGIRLSLRYPDLFKVQLRAILRASVHGNLKIMYPMITSLEELRQANKILNDVKLELQAANVAFDKDIKVGIMIETPSAAVIADWLAREADFLSLGTNDLIQYTLAVDRVNENVAHLYNPLHMAVLRLIRSTIEAAHAAGKWVGICGEMAGNPSFTRILIGLGLDEFSVPAAAVPRIKRLIRETSLEDAKKLVDRVFSQSSDTEDPGLFSRIS
jgi:phosphotransferase system enzyme I (PtsI)